MRVLVIAGWMFPDAEGGSFRAVYESAKGLRARGHEVTVLTQRLNSKLPKDEMLNGIRIIRYKTYPNSSLTFFASTIFLVFWKSLWIRRNFDVVHAHHLVPTFGFCLANFFPPRKPLVYNFYMARFLEYEDEEAFKRGEGRKTYTIKLFSWILRKMEYFILKSAKDIVVYSEYVRGIIREYYPKGAAKTVLIKPGVDLVRFYPTDRKSVREKLNLKLEHFIILTVRRLEPRMGIENLIHAMRKISEGFPQVRLVLIGRGSLEKRYRKLVKELGLESTIFFTGWIPDDILVQYYQASDLFILPTRALEGFGLVSLESLACGTPVMGTPVGATPEILGPLGKNFLFKDETWEAISLGIMDWVYGPFKGAELNSLCRRYVEENYQWDSHIQHLEKMIRDFVRRN